MKKKDSQANVLYRVTFSASESEQLKKKAEEVGMSVNGYIKQMALEGKVQYIDWGALRQHTELISDIAMWIHLFVVDLRKAEPEYEPNLSILNHYVEDIVSLERELYLWLGLEPAA